MQPYGARPVLPNAMPRWVIPVVVVSCLAGVIRVGVAVSDPLWLDELHTAWCCSAESQDVAIDRAAQGNQTPFFYWLEYQITQVLGLSEFGLRWISLVAGILLVGLAAGWTANFTNSLLAGTLTGLIAAIEPSLIFYATEARPYALLQLAGLMQFICFATVWKLGNRGREADSTPPESATGRPPLPRSQLWRVGLMITTAVIPWLHLTGAILIAAQLLWCLFQIRNPGARLCLKMMFLGGVAIIPLLALTQTVASHHSDWAAVSDSAGLIREWGTLLLIWGVAPLGGMVISGFVAGRQTGIRWRLPTHPLPLLIWCIVVPPAALVFADQALDVPIALSRYAQASAGLLPVLAGMIVGLMGAARQPAIASDAPRSPEEQGRGASGGTAPMTAMMSGSAASRRWTAILVMLLTMWLSPVFDTFLTKGRLPEFRREDWKFAVARLNEQAKPDEPLFLFSNLVEDHRVAQMPSRPLTVEDQEFLEYLRFPVRGIYRAVNDDVRPRSTWAAPRFWSQDPDVVVRALRGWILIRGTPELVAAICRDFRQAYDGNVSSDFQLENQLEISGEELVGSNVFLIQLKVIPRDVSELPNP